VIVPLMLAALLIADPPDADAGVFSYKVAGGARLKRLHEVPIYQGGADLDFGSRMGDLAIFAGPDLALGKTDAGLSTTSVRVHFDIQHAIERVWLGAIADIGYLRIRRVTESSSLTTLTAGVGVLLEIDVVEFDRAALFIGARGDVEAPDGMWGLTLNLGWRG
jgi:hypothetical protein